MRYKTRHHIHIGDTIFNIDIIFGILSLVCMGYGVQDKQDTESPREFLRKDDQIKNCIYHISYI